MSNRRASRSLDLDQRCDVSPAPTLPRQHTQAGREPWRKKGRVRNSGSTSFSRGPVRGRTTGAFCWTPARSLSDVDRMWRNWRAIRKPTCCAASSIRWRNCWSCIWPFWMAFRTGSRRRSVLRQSEEIRPASDRDVPRAADRPRQIGLQVGLDPRQDGPGRVPRKRLCRFPGAGHQLGGQRCRAFMRTSSASIPPA